MTKYYLTRINSEHRWTLCLRPFATGERILFEDYATAKAEMKRLNAAIPARKKAPGGGRQPKPHVRHNLTIRADLSERLVKTAERDGVSITAVIEGLIESNLKI